MIIDIAKEIGAITREVAKQQTEGGEIVAVTLQRHYPAEVADVWQAITDPDRVRRWFLPLSGDLREGGNFQLEGHAGGDILSCEPPRHLVVTFGGETASSMLCSLVRTARRCCSSPTPCQSSWPAVAPAPCTSDLVGTVP